MLLPFTAPPKKPPTFCNNIKKCNKLRLIETCHCQCSMYCILYNFLSCDLLLVSPHKGRWYVYAAEEGPGVSWPEGEILFFPCSSLPVYLSLVLQPFILLQDHFTLTSFQCSTNVKAIIVIKVLKSAWLLWISCQVAELVLIPDQYSAHWKVNV